MKNAIRNWKNVISNHDVSLTYLVNTQFAEKEMNQLQDESTHSVFPADSQISYGYMSVWVQ